jgi:septin family protein
MYVMMTAEDWMTETEASPHTGWPSLAQSRRKRPQIRQDVGFFVLVVGSGKEGKSIAVKSVPGMAVGSN